MSVSAHEPSGFEGVVVAVDVDIRRGIPSVDLVGLADGAIREARERVRAAVRNSGFEFPLDRVLVSLSPAGLRKEGSSYDLPIALAVLIASGALPDPGRNFLAIGELRLDGSLRPVRAVLPAVAAGLGAGLERFIVPEENLAEALSLRRGLVYPMSRLAEAVDVLVALRAGLPPRGRPSPALPAEGATEAFGDFAEVKGLARARRALEVAAAGGHHVLLFGPPGSGKTLVARRFPGILPALGEGEAIEATMLHSLAGLPIPEGGLLRNPPLRSPHHSASLEGLVGGGRTPRPGEISLAHRGVLFLDEAMEFRRDALQALREPLEEGRVSISRAACSTRFPAAFLLVAAANPCPCGNLGRRGRVCVCSPPEILRYWRKLGAPLLDRIDIRVPLRPADGRSLRGPGGEASAAIRARVEAARALQRERYAGQGFALNAQMPPACVERICGLADGAQKVFERAVSLLGLSSRASHSLLKVARTIADLSGGGDIDEGAVLEAAQHRRYGDQEFYWDEPC